MKKYHVSVFTTNLLAIVLAIFFIRGYKAREIPIINVYIIVLIILVAFILLSLFILKPHGKIKNIFPEKRLLLLNALFSILFPFLFLADIGLLGFLFVIKFSFLLFEAEHIIYEGFGR